MDPLILCSQFQGPNIIQIQRQLISIFLVFELLKVLFFIFEGLCEGKLLFALAVQVL